MEKLVRDARHDGLTGLPNRRSIFERLDAALLAARPANTGAVLFVDLDGLKKMNDTLGHDQADAHDPPGRRAAVDGAYGRRTSSGASAAMSSWSSPRAPTHEHAAAARGADLLDVISRPLSGIASTVVTASVGIALMGEGDGDAGEAIRHADSAMYAAKRCGRRRLQLLQGQQTRADRETAVARTRAP